MHTLYLLYNTEWNTIRIENSNGINIQKYRGKYQLLNFHHYILRGTKPIITYHRCEFLTIQLISDNKIAHVIDALCNLLH